MLLGFGAAAIYHTPDAAAGGFFHLFHPRDDERHGLSGSRCAVLRDASSRHGDHVPLTGDDLNGAIGRYPLAALH